jgi:hypothetical protein
VQLHVRWPEARLPVVRVLAELFRRPRRLTKEWPPRIAETAMFLVDHQSNLALAEEFGEAPDRLPIRVSANISVGNALLMNWREILPAAQDVFVFGNPPFVGSRLQSTQQKTDQQIVWQGVPKLATLDYVSNWFLKTARYLNSGAGRAAFVATSAITHGEQPAIMWSQLKPMGFRIDFAHRSFAWKNEAQGQAGVHVVVIGFSAKSSSGTRPLYVYDQHRGKPQMVRARLINAYLVDGPDVLVTSRRRPLESTAPLMLSGNVPRDGGHLSKITDSEAQAIRRSDPIAARYLRRIYGSDEHIQGDVRWCLWLEDAPPGDIRSSRTLRERVELVRRERAGAAGSKGKAVDRPHLFADIYQPNSGYLMVPSVCSDRRPYVPIAFYQAEDILTNAVFAIPDASHYTFGVLASTAFLRWVSVVSSRLGPGLQLSSGMSYNTFPWPRLESAQESAVRACAQEVLDQRTKMAGSTLADLYDPLAMPVGLRAAHRRLDAMVLSGYGLKVGASESEVEAALFRRYAADLKVDAGEIDGRYLGAALSSVSY